MREVSQIEVYEVLKGKIGEQEAKLLIEYIEIKKKEIATKEDIMRLEEVIKMVEKSTKEDIQRLEEFVKEELQRIEQSTKEDIQRLEKDIQRVEKRVENIENEINELRKEQRRNLYWILGVHITLWATTIGGIITILLKMKF
jgi:Na+/phosphate symporter